MWCGISRFARWWLVGTAAVAVIGGGASQLLADGPVVPGTGIKLSEVSDDFEDKDWKYEPNLPKSSSNVDGQVMYPLGGTANGLWIESALRGQPDQIKRVATPPNGLPGSQGALLLRTHRSGGQYSHSFEQQQDDLQMNASSLLGGYMTADQCPSLMVRVFLPPWERWEQRVGSHFGIRADCQSEQHQMWMGRRSYWNSAESYWPGMFIQFNGKSGEKDPKYSATVLVRGNELGHDIPKLEITETGWWTFGLSITGDGLVHYYARKGVQALTSRDRISTMLPYGHRAATVGTFFFNVTNHDDGRSWSTPWIIDDPAIYVLHRRPRGY